MLKQTIEILSSFSKPKKTCAMGNVAISRGAIEAGVKGVFSYPGTPSTEISEVFHYVNNFQANPENIKLFPRQTASRIYFEYSINEKIALEKAIAYTLGGNNAMCIMKNVGMNVASDALMSVTYQRIGAGLVIVICDDPGCHSSSNEQDSRFWGAMASVPVFDPATPAQAYEMSKEAFALSENIKLPVILRSTTRVSHTRGIFSYGKISPQNSKKGFERLPENINIPARSAAAHTRLLEKLKSPAVMKSLAENSNVIVKNKKASHGIICSGVAVPYILEILHRNSFGLSVRVLSLEMIHPFPEKEVLAFLSAPGSPEKFLVLEELEPFIENAVRIIAQKNEINKKILGKGFGGLLPAGEFSLDLIKKTLEDFLQISMQGKRNIPLENSEKFCRDLPPRPPALCAGCPHRATFYLLKLAIPRNENEMILCGDIGCFGLGALPPLKMIDTINHMGMSISMAQGLYESLNFSGRDKKIAALVGDGTFFHSGLASLVNAVYTKANILIVIFDNRTIGMTGHQPHPGASEISKYHQIDIASLIKGIGVKLVETINPFDIRSSFNKINLAMEHSGVSVIIAKAPCIFLHSFNSSKKINTKIAVNPALCNSCANHEDHSLACSRCHAPENNLSRAKAKLLAKVSIPGKDQLCPANICNHGFFNSILEGNYKSAVEIVRDKMLFASTCGDICHRPCEISESSVPIKALKKFAASADDNFLDFSIPVQRAKNAVKKNKTVAVIGSGPAGLSATYELVQWGYEVSIFEKEKTAGGMVTSAIPYFRMDKIGFGYEAMQLEKMGVKFYFETKLGQDFSLDEIRKKFDAVVLAIGLSSPKTLKIIEAKVPGKYRTDALRFLKSFNQKKCSIGKASSILIIGGGNSAIDAARAAKLWSNKNKVFLSCIETEANMPAFSEETAHAKNEGIIFLTNSYVRKIMLKRGRINVSLHEFTNKNYFRDLTCDHIITAIGQLNQLHLPSIPIDGNTRIICEGSNTGYNNIFAAGDIVSGNHMSVIGAIASGKKAAVAVRVLLENYKYGYEGEQALHDLNKNSSSKKINKTYEIKRDDVRQQIKHFNLYQSCYKCNHCIDNFGCPAMVKVNGKVEIDLKRCTLCGLCIDVCPNNAIHWVEEEVIN